MGDVCKMSYWWFITKFEGTFYLLGLFPHLELSACKSLEKETKIYSVLEVGYYSQRKKESQSYGNTHKFYSLCTFANACLLYNITKFCY